MNTMSNASVTPITTTSKPKRRAPQGGKRKRAKQLGRMESALTLVLGCGIPLLSLALSRIAGALYAQHHLVLAYTLAVLVLCVLAVSLSHVAEAIREITGSERWLSWSLAIAIDASLVTCEVVNVTAAIEQITCWLVIGAVVAVSAALNVYAFKLSQQRR